MRRVCLFAVLLVVSPVAFFGCGGKRAAVKKDYGKPTWLKLDKSTFAKLSDYETTLEGGTVTVFDPEGWERMPSGSAKPPQGFKSVIVFQKQGATIMMTKSNTAKDMPDLDEENIEGFADSAQQLFRAPVKMLKIGSIIGVMFAKQVADKNRISRKLNRRIVATSINGQLFTYEIVSDDKITDNLLGALYAVISKTKIEGVEAPPEEPVVVETPVGEPTSEDKPAETAVTETPKPEQAKPAPSKPPKDKKNTKAILDELDALLN